MTGDRTPQERTSPSAPHRAVSAIDDGPPRLSIPSPDDARCAVRVVLDRVADKWTALIVAVLADGPIYYSDLRRAAAGVSHKMLAQTLRNLERDGLVERTIVADRPIRVRYALTDFGETLVPPLAALRPWAEVHGAVLAANQEDCDRRRDAHEAASQGIGDSPGTRTQQNPRVESGVLRGLNPRPHVSGRRGRALRISVLGTPRRWSVPPRPARTTRFEYRRPVRQCVRRPGLAPSRWSVAEERRTPRPSR